MTAKNGSSTAPVVYMWWAHTPMDRAPMDRVANDHALVAEDGLPGEGRDDLGGHPEERQGQDVDLGVAEEPEQVLPQDGLAAVGRVEEVRPQVPVDPEQDEGGGEHREGQQDQEDGDQLVPDEDRHAEHDHARRPQAEDGGDHVDGGEDAGEAGQGHAHDPQVAAGARGVDGLGEGGVGEPAPVGGARRWSGSRTSW